MGALPHQDIVIALMTYNATDNRLINKHYHCCFYGENYKKMHFKLFRSNPL